jgi:hypothetical protein
MAQVPELLLFVRGGNALFTSMIRGAMVSVLLMNKRYSPENNFH